MKSLRKDHVIDPYKVGSQKALPKNQKHSNSFKKQSSERKYEKKKKRKKSIAHRFFDVAEDVFDLFD